MSRRGASKTTAVLAAVAGAAAAVVVAVDPFAGDDGQSMRDYLAEVTAICQQYGERLDRVPPPVDISSPGAVVSSIELALPLLREQLSAVRSLPAPKTFEKDLEQFFQLTDRSLVELELAYDAAFERELFPMAEALTRFGEVRDEAKQISRRLGFRC